MSDSAANHGPFSVSETDGPCEAFASEIEMSSVQIRVDARYNVRHILGNGAYGVVFSAKDSKTGEKVAIKKMEKTFDHTTLTKRTLRELKIMRILQHDNILHLRTIQLPVSYDTLDEIYVVMDKMETDLSEVIKSPQELRDEHCQFFLYQVLRGLKYIHTANIVHRDLKPRNILVNSNCDLKICDFGLARTWYEELGGPKAARMTDYVSTRWYRAPEVLLKLKMYTTAMDMWAVGCILAELLLRRPFLPGTSTEEQIGLILGTIGMPDRAEIDRISVPKAREKLQKVSLDPNISDFETVFADCNPLAVDLLRKLLTFNPEERLTVQQSLAHPYLQAYHCEEDEPSCEPASRYDFEFESQLLTGADLKAMIHEEIMLHHFPSKQQEYQSKKAAFEAAIRGSG